MLSIYSKGGYTEGRIQKWGNSLGAILSDQIRSLDWKARKAKFAAFLPNCILEQTLAKFMVLLP